MEATPLLRTKLDAPPTRAHTLARERLLVLAPDAPGTRLVLLSAPAGFGKTTFLATWCRARAAQGAAVAWLALDEDDNEPARFLAYLQAAIARALQSLDYPNDAVDAAWPGTADRAVALTRLINGLAAFDHDLVLVLDDYHLISAPAIHATVAFLLDHLPDRVCLAIGSRADPPLALARLRVREQLVELRATQLRFTAEEIQAFFQLVGNLPLSLEEAHAISAYAEGWPAGVQLIALALKAEAQEQEAEVAAAPTSLQRVFARLDASQRQVFAYLADDVFERQPPHLKSFLLQTAMLERICAPLCDAVLGLAPDEHPKTNDEQAFDKLESVSNVIHPLSSFVLRPSSDSYSRLLLEELERANLFIIPLDHERRWYRYHHLFHAFLRARLDCEPPGALAELHRRASVWFECHQFVSSAVEHALAAGHSVHAAELIEGLAMMLIERGEYATLHGWLERIPETSLAVRPALCLWAAWAALLAGDVERIEPLLGRAERAWQSAGDQSRLGEVAHLQAHLARLRYDGEATIAAARQALAGLAEDAQTLRAGSLLALGTGQLLTGDLVAAATTLPEAYRQCQAHNFLGMLVALRCLGDLAVQRGQLGEAARNYRDVIQAVGERAAWERWAAAIRLGDLSRERNDLDGGLETLRAAMTAAEQAGVAVYLPDGYIALARTLAAQQDFVAAEVALDRAIHVAHRLGSPSHISRIRAYQTRLALARGDLATAEQWQIEAAPNLDGRLCATHEIEALTLARMLIAQGRSDPSRRSLGAAHSLLEQLRQDAVAQGRINSQIEIAIVSALAATAARQHERALSQIRQALEMAGEQGYARIFLDEGAPMAELLQSLALRHADEPRDAQSDTIGWYVDRLHSAFPTEQLAAVANRSHVWPLPCAALDRSDALVEVLSERELQVLRLIAGGASNQAIAATLVISLGTVKSHINHILGKLAASNRTEAVARARTATADQLTLLVNGATLPPRFMRQWIVLSPWLTPISCEGITWRHQIFSHWRPLHCYAGTS